MKEKRPGLADRIRQGLKEGIEYAHGDRELKTTFVPNGRNYSGDEIADIRKRRNMSQAQFARLLAVSVKTLQSWEQNARTPSKPTMRLLQIFDQPDEFRSILIREDGASYQSD